MRTYIATLQSISPYSQSRFQDDPRKDRETADDHEKRTWRGRMHVDASGNVFIPPMAFKNCLSEAAKFRGEQIPGKGKSNYTKHFEAGILISDTVDLGVKADDVTGEWLFVPADGKRGGGKRVKKCFPVIASWKASVVIHVLDDLVTKDVLQRHLDDAGAFIGIGRFRPRNNGFYGRFKVVKLQEQK
jgi:hypothetical protein